MKVRVFLAAAAAASALWATGASALVEVQARGGWGQSEEEFPYAREYLNGPALFADYGSGAFGELDVSLGALGFGIEAGADFILLDEASDTGGPLDGGACATESFLGLIDECYDAAFVDADTQVITADLLLKKRLSNIFNLSFALGATGLFLDSNLAAEYLYPGGNENFVDRDTSLDAYGVKAGLEHSLPIANTGVSLNTEVYGGWLWGERTVSIHDERTNAGVFSTDDAALIVEDIDVPTVDASISLSYDLNSVISLEAGGKYRRLFGAMFTEYTAVYDDPADFGSDSADLDYWAVFGGLIFTL